MASAIKIGTWIERSARQITRCPSYYAADTETLELQPGAYDARLTFEGGYTVPMPYWLLIGIDSKRVDGRLYSGVGGVNFASTELPAGEPVTYTIQTYAYTIKDHVATGRLILAPGLDWLLGEGANWEHPSAPKTWADVAQLAALQAPERALAALAGAEGK